jgi:hypothetical protein
MSEKIKTDFLRESADGEAIVHLSPTTKSAQSAELKSQPSLDAKVNTIIGREAFFPDWQASSTDEAEAATISYNADMDYLLLLAYNSQDETRSVEERQRWADAYTEQSIKIYGEPDADFAKILEAGGWGKIVEKYQPVLSAVKDHLYKNYGKAFAALGLEGKTEQMPPEEIATALQNGLLEVQNTGKLQGWAVELFDGAGVRTVADRKVIGVGSRTKPKDPQDVPGTFAHEALRHAMTADNAESLGIETALPRYLAMEEGFAVLYALSVTGRQEFGGIDRYVDIAFALGKLDGKRHTRSEIVNREIEREMQKGGALTEKLVKSANNYANRIFRGTPGRDDISGIFTKDISYAAGIIPAMEYIKQNLDSGKTIDEVMVLANAAKFNPNDPAQKQYIESKITDRYLPKLPLLLPAPPDEKV